MNYKFLTPVILTAILAFNFSSFDTNSTVDSKPKVVAAVIEKKAVTSEEAIYEKLDSNNLSLPALDVFSEALKGFQHLKEKGLVSKNILTVIDFSMSSNLNRLWVIDLNTNSVLFNTLVAHGKNTGDEFATSFSNVSSSFRSSLGFYATGEIYVGKHGKSLRLDGLESGINSNARERAVVIHGADYVSQSFIKNNSRLGRSLGCPAIPVALTNDIIQTIKDKSCLFIYYPSNGYKVSSKLIS
ncbi:murein L,D-transpeptidase catalytic domain family protein [Flavobacterium frigidarium]|uniref:murein L,D-transpeptidase catalytic domain family protein n=1 Tax=Flavobacterium frigidarium TaxID=99286 RepID=UPI0003F77D44|nr:murein L,D-transpeptidase catalytic domain family protein [Flavobacterium frigidarium]